VTVKELKRLCADRGLLVVSESERRNGEPPRVVVLARSNNGKLADLPSGLRTRPAGVAYTVIEIADG
jgi:hypothetical protein